MNQLVYVARIENLNSWETIGFLTGHYYEKPLLYHRILDNSYFYKGKIKFRLKSYAFKVFRCRMAKMKKEELRGTGIRSYHRSYLIKKTFGTVIVVLYICKSSLPPFHLSLPFLLIALKKSNSKGW